MEEKFFNRELSWLEFNYRVLREAKNPKVPLLERFNFLTIVSSNFDEFFMVRVAGLKRQSEKYPDRRDPSGLTPREQLEKISARAQEITEIQYDCLINEITPALARNKIRYITPEKYTSKVLPFLENYFYKEVFPQLTPLRVPSKTEESKNFPHISNKRIYAGFVITKTNVSSEIAINTNPLDKKMYSDNTEKERVVFVQIPQSIDRIIALPSENEEYNFALLDDVIKKFGTQLFPGFDVVEGLLFKVSRDADFSVDEERDEDFIQAMEEVLENRESSGVVRLVSSGKSKKILDILIQNFDLKEKDIYYLPGPLDLASLKNLCNIEGFNHLKNPSWKNFWPTSLPKDQPFWDTLKLTDVLLRVPYESYDPVVQFINDAAEDSQVTAIKITLYRTSGNSPIVKALENAAQNGKHVTAFVELKARFDEGKNISWSKKLERAGVIVVYGIAHLKVHAKVMLVIRREENTIRRYVHLATGNFNEKTAKGYSDISLLTSNSDIANDVTLFFNMITGYSAIQNMKCLRIAPIDLKSKLLELISREIKRSSKQNPGKIVAKMNSLSDPEIISALYKASCAGVKVLLNIRGICMLVPGIKGMSENITVISIVDRFLEHSRIFYFENGGTEEVYLSSADWMPRNLERRVELMVPVLQDSINKTIIEMLKVYFMDNEKAKVLQPDGFWIDKPKTKNEKPLRAQEEFYNIAKTRANVQKVQPKQEFVVRRK